MAWTGNVITRYYRELLQFCLRKVKNPETAADLVQDSFVRVLTMERAGQAILDPRALLRQVALHLKIDMDRRAAIRQHEDLDSLPETEMPAVPAHLQPEQACAAIQSAHAYLEAIDSLPTRCREAFQLYAFEGLPNKEIAERMGISLSMVNQYISRGKLACAACREALEAAPAAR
ncbi:RNA polymerase sigma factor [Herbaspirillum huttiense F1]|uniref:RNA polymerase sigma factor n=1 Tax=Herbaspirillum huttiense subsp. lycopersici TaxID=3074428 RepID=A0ABU2EVF4_9BURK|nr:RNA polymerase sigma factor [Herbaspirillum huttiense]MDR9851817.1 RNA polymerase sigma factor [Herbaspirillum huttiense SE1]MDT0358104.1 RNA polymerase sigma factor [Herbaspirillum huttiense F1]